MTFGKLIKKHRAAQGISMFELGNRSGMPRTIIWRAEHGLATPRPETMRKIAIGLGLSEGSKAWSELFEAWGGDRTGQALTPKSMAESIKKASTYKGKAVKELTAMISNLSADDFEQVRLALSRPSVMAGIRALNAIYEEKG